jgi:hypothetical protein
VAAAAVPSPALAWGDHGHRAIADIAWTQMSGSTRREVVRLHEAEPALATPACCVRSRYKERFYNTSSWHYVNVSICRPFGLPDDPNAKFVVARLGWELAILRDRTKPRVIRLEALLWVAHLAGDIHQPLHVGDAGDRGGNQVSVTPQTGRYPVNLHSEWDRMLADEAIDAAPGGVAGLALAASDANNKLRWQTGSASTWARESWALSRKIAYGEPAATRCSVPSSTVDVGGRYVAAAVPVVQIQIERAGVRLAVLLNAALE